MYAWPNHAPAPAAALSAADRNLLGYLSQHHGTPAPSPALVTDYDQLLRDAPDLSPDALATLRGDAPALEPLYGDLGLDQ